MDQRISLLSEMTKIEYDGAPFNGPSLMKTLEELDVDQVLSTDTHEGYSVWGIVLHLIFWKYSLSRQLGGSGGFDTFPYEEKDWPALPEEKTKDAWDSVLNDMATVHKAYIDALESFPAEKLGDELALWHCSYLKAVSWMATHDLYHVAQIRNMGAG